MVAASLQYRCIIVAKSPDANIVSNATQAMVTASLLFRYIFVTIIRPTSRPAVKSRPTRRGMSAQIPPRPLLPSASVLALSVGHPVPKSAPEATRFKRDSQPPPAADEAVWGSGRVISLYAKFAIALPSPDQQVIQSTGHAYHPIQPISQRPRLRASQSKAQPILKSLRGSDANFAA